MVHVPNSSSQSTGFTREHEHILSEARKRLRQHHQFRGREHLLRVDERDGTLILRGRVPSFYIKQLLQNAMKDIDGVAQLDNQVKVLYPK